MFFSRSAGMKMVSRGDPSSFDLSVGDFTQDGVWNVADLSAVIESNVKWILCRFTGTASNFSYTFSFRPAGNTNSVFVERIQQKVVGTIPDRSFWLPVTSARTIEYASGGGAWIIADFAVLATLK